MSRDVNEVFEGELFEIETEEEEEEEDGIMDECRRMVDGVVVECNVVEERGSLVGVEREIIVEVGSM